MEDTMKIIKKQTRQYFRRYLARRYFDFLAERKITAESYISSLKNGQYGIVDSNCFSVDEIEYNLKYILGSSKESIYDLIRVNQIYSMSPDQGTIIAICLGDEYVFLKPNEDAVFFNCGDSDEDFKVAENYQDFLNMLNR